MTVRQHGKYSHHPAIAFGPINTHWPEDLGISDLELHFSHPKNNCLLTF